MMYIKDMPPADRPRERIATAGAHALSDRELVSAVLGTGIKGKRIDLLADEVLAILDRLGRDLTYEDLRAVSGLGEAKSSILCAAFELARRVYSPDPSRIRVPADVLPAIRHYADRKQEHFLSVSLNGAHEIIAVRVVSVGLVNRTIVHPREVFADPLTDRAAAVIVAHNHPSGQVQPSMEDRDVTRRLISAGETLGLKLLDHVVFSALGYYSFLEHGDL